MHAPRAKGFKTQHMFMRQTGRVLHKVTFKTNFKSQSVSFSFVPDIRNSFKTKFLNIFLSNHLQINVFSPKHVSLLLQFTFRSSLFFIIPLCFLFGCKITFVSLGTSLVLQWLSIIAHS